MLTFEFLHETVQIAVPHFCTRQESQVLSHKQGQRFFIVGAHGEISLRYGILLQSIVNLNIGIKHLFKLVQNICNWLREFSFKNMLLECFEVLEFSVFFGPINFTRTVEGNTSRSRGKLSGFQGLHEFKLTQDQSVKCFRLVLQLIVQHSAQLRVRCS